MGPAASNHGNLIERTQSASARIAEQPRIYADANIPIGIVAFMRERLRWDVLFVLEHEDLRRARDIEHYRLARQLGRTIVTLDSDYIDDRQFPPGGRRGRDRVLGARRAATAFAAAKRRIGRCSAPKAPGRCPWRAAKFTGDRTVLVEPGGTVEPRRTLLEPRRT